MYNFSFYSFSWVYSHLFLVKFMYLCHRLKRHKRIVFTGVRFVHLILSCPFWLHDWCIFYRSIDSRLWKMDILWAKLKITELKITISIENRKKDNPMGMDPFTLFCGGSALYCRNRIIPAGLYANGLVRCRSNFLYFMALPPLGYQTSVESISWFD